MHIQFFARFFIIPKELFDLLLFLFVTFEESAKLPFVEVMNIKNWCVHFPMLEYAIFSFEFFCYDSFLAFFTKLWNVLCS